MGFRWRLSIREWKEIESGGTTALTAIERSEQRVGGGGPGEGIDFGEWNGECFEVRGERDWRSLRLGF